MNQYATLQQMAGMIVQAPRSGPTPKFKIIVRTSGACELRLSIDFETRLSATREPGIARSFATVPAALRIAQQIAMAAGYRDDHDYTGRADDLPCMPGVEMYLLTGQ